MKDHNDINGCFVCDFCRNICKGPCDTHLLEIAQGKITDENKDLAGRKQRIKCLGRFCEHPCEYQDLSQYEGVDLTPFLNEIRYLVGMVNSLLMENKE